MYFDGHVHFRDWKEKGKETIGHGLEVALRAGVDGVLDMPNTNPPIITRGLAEDRIRLFGLEEHIKRTENEGDLNLREYSYGNYL